MMVDDHLGAVKRESRRDDSLAQRGTALPGTSDGPEPACLIEVDHGPPADGQFPGSATTLQLR